MIWRCTLPLAAAGTGDALIGSSCYKDVLQPVAVENAAGNPLNPLGTGPFKNEDGDTCGEANQGDPALSTGGAIYQLQQSITVTCNDANNDGVVDPISTCLSWANNAGQYTCNAVVRAGTGPGTTSKCNCEETAPNPPILLYKGYDFWRPAAGRGCRVQLSHQLQLPDAGCQRRPEARHSGC